MLYGERVRIRVRGRVRRFVRGRDRGRVSFRVRVGVRVMADYCISEILGIQNVNVKP